MHGEVATKMEAGYPETWKKDSKMTVKMKMRMAHLMKGKEGR